jgi:predicted sulfurtransferase
VLLGRSPISPADLITPAKFNAHLLEARDFEAMVGNDSIVLDVRDRAQRDTPLFPFKERRAQLDETAILDAAIADAKAQKKTLLVYDAVGKQVEWFQYRIEAKGLKDYYFLKGGSHGYFETTLGKVELGHGQATPVRHQKTAAK